MKTEQFSKALNNVNDKYIEEAADYQGKAANASLKKQNKPGRSNKGLKVWRAIAIAACAVLVAGISFVVIINSLSVGSKYSASSKNDEGYGISENGGDYYYAVGGTEAIHYDEERPAESPISPDGWEEMPVPSVNDNNTQILDNNKIIYRAYLSMETTEFDKAVSDLETLVKNCGGFLEWAEVDSISHNYRCANYTIRIPADRLDSFLSQAGSLCTVKNSNKSAEDVSKYYYDTESRLDTAKTKLERLQQLLIQAATMEDIIELEREISDTEQTIDDLTGTLKQYDSLIDYSTVDIDLKEVYKTDSGTQPLSFAQKVSNSFNNSIRNFGEFLEDVVVWFACSWIWLLILAVIAVATVIITKKAVNKKKNKPEK